MTTHVHNRPNDTTSQPDPSPLGKTQWNTWEAGVTLTPREFVDESAVLLQGVLEATVDVEPGLLVEQLRATLSLDARESSLPLPPSADAPPVTRQLASQANLIGEEISAWVENVLESVLAEPIALPQGPLAMRSHCEGHPWTPPVAHRLLGRLGGPVAAQLFNEWLHQIVLLRDALLPFANWTEVPLMVTSAGLRRLEPARERFLAEALIRQVRHTTIVDYARQVVTDTAGPAGYGFESAMSAATGTATGTALPEVVHGPLGTSASYLLAWHPAEAETTTPEITDSEVTTYVYETDDYYAAPRTPLESLSAASQDSPDNGASIPVTARIVTHSAARDTQQTAHIELTRGSEIATVDLGQALRGHRFSYRQPSNHAPNSSDEAASTTPYRRVEAWDVLSAPGLVWAQNGYWSVDTTAIDGLGQLALLGKLYPENVVLRRSADRGAEIIVGKDGPARILVEIAD